MSTKLKTSFGSLLKLFQRKQQTPLIFKQVDEFRIYQKEWIAISLTLLIIFLLTFTAIYNRQSLKVKIEKKLEILDSEPPLTKQKKERTRSKATKQKVD